MDFGEAEDRRGLFGRNSSTRFAGITDGLSQTPAAGERPNGRFAVLGSVGHLFAETVWVGAMKEDPDDDHGHTTLFRTGHIPRSREMDDRDETSRHPAGVNHVFGDGTVRFLEESVAPSVYRASITRAGDEAMNADSY